jgi:hypothetical protein
MYREKEEKTENIKNKKDMRPIEIFVKQIFTCFKIKINLLIAIRIWIFD